MEKVKGLFNCSCSKPANRAKELNGERFKLPRVQGLGSLFGFRSEFTNMITYPAQSESSAGVNSPQFLHVRNPSLL